MQAPQTPVLPAVAAIPIVLICTSCEVETIVDPERHARRVELAAFFAAHDGHGGRTGYTVEIPITQDHPEPRALKASSTHTSREPLAGMASIVWAPRSERGGAFWRGTSDRGFGRRHRQFT
jgi:hypothetical protein